jgi:hypothetical protein
MSLESIVGNNNHLIYREEDPLTRTIGWIGSIPAKLMFLEYKIGETPSVDT